MGDNTFDPKGRVRASILILCVAAALFLTYYFHKVLAVGEVFTHFYYVPVVLACMWWGRKGLWVVALMVGFLVFSHLFFRETAETYNDYFRAAMFLAVGVVVVFLSEGIAKGRMLMEQREAWYRTLFENTGTATVIVERDTRVSQINLEFEKLSGFGKAEVEEKKSWFDFIADKDRERILGYHSLRREGDTRAPRNYEFGLVTKQGELKDIHATVALLPETEKAVVSCSDVTGLRKALEEQRTLQRRLTEALAKALSGYIPICARCKKIRDEKQEWVQVEQYVHERTEAKFSHGICPDCARELYPDIVEELEKKKGTTQ